MNIDWSIMWDLRAEIPRELHIESTFLKKTFENLATEDLCGVAEKGQPYGHGIESRPVLENTQTGVLQSNCVQRKYKKCCAQVKRKARRNSVIRYKTATSPLTSSRAENGIADNTKGTNMKAISIGKTISELR